MYKSGATFFGEIASVSITMTSSRVLHRQFHVEQAHWPNLSDFVIMPPNLLVR